MARKWLLAIGICSLIFMPFEASPGDDEEGSEKKIELPEVVVQGTLIHPPGETVIRPGGPEEGLPADSGELLRSVPGVSGARMGGHGIDPVIRGQAENRITILLDGAYVYGGCPNRMDPPSSYAPYESYDRIIVLKGPRSVVQTGASGGTVMFERDNPPFQPGGHWRGRLSTAYAGNGNRFQGLVDAAAGLPSAYLRAIYDHAEADSYKDGNGEKVPSSFLVNHAAFMAGWTPDPAFRLDLGWEMVDTDNVLYPGAGMDAPVSDSGLFRAKVEWRDPSALLSGLRAEFYQSAVEHTMDNYSLRPLTAPSPLNVETSSDTTGGRVILEFSDQSTHWTAGFDLQNNLRKAIRYSGPDQNHVDTVQSLLWPEASLNQYGIFSELEQDLGHNAVIVAGLRYDRIEASVRDAGHDPPGGPMSPKTLYALYYGENADDRSEDNLGAIVRLEKYAGEDRLLYFLNLSRVVRTADATERFMAANGMTPAMRWVGNPAIRPEIHHQAEAGLLQGGGDWQLSAAAYYDLVSDLILRDTARGQDGVLQSDGAGIYRNVNGELFGAEIEARWHWNRNLSSSIALSYVYALNRTDQRAVAQIPPLTSDLGLDYERTKWSAGARLRMTAVQTRVDDNPKTGSGLDAGRTPGYGVIDLYGTVSLHDDVDLMLGVNNLLDHAYAEHLNKPNAFDPKEIQVNEPGRVVWVKLRAGY